jgi:hypothetical protein
MLLIKVNIFYLLKFVVVYSQILQKSEGVQQNSTKLGKYSLLVYYTINKETIFSFFSNATFTV